MCTRAVIVNRGRIVFDGTPEDLAARAPMEGRPQLDVVFRELTTSDVPAVGAERIESGVGA
ncbi:hypothetical protein Pla86_32030 [Planctomycetes bacterium Pla86]|uniref:Uncharacterized protein n=1 Tax=Engelhardtia mirabilis TaxID=2528011 RepID=A0A518BMA2_9BACT|nr:hypothetical protein Pla133_32040 [Planctomycetes bacterium Pla133]QDV02436.1 hypothetical protein Pla86_32030 [Planctomycetes bacterium Pla86]